MVRSVVVVLAPDGSRELLRVESELPPEEAVGRVRFHFRPRREGSPAPAVEATRPPRPPRPDPRPERPTPR